MNKVIGLGIGVAAVVIAVVVGSTVFTNTEFNSFTGLPNDDSNQMKMGDKISVTVTSSDETDQQEEQVAEGKNVEVNLVDGVSATSEP